MVWSRLPKEQYAPPLIGFLLFVIDESYAETNLCNQPLDESYRAILEDSASIDFTKRHFI